MKFRRKKSDQVADEEVEIEAVETPAPDVPAATDGRPDGPWDSTEVDLEDDTSRVDLGSLLIAGRQGLELRLQVGDAGQVAAVLLVGPDGAVELRPFAAPRNPDIWDDTWDDLRRQIAAETARRGGTATESDGVYGKELEVVVPVTAPDGKAATQPSRVHGIQGPRWLLRATFLGKPALEPDPEGLVETALREVVVVRGSKPMAPGEPLPLVMPPDAKPAQPD